MRPALMLLIATSAIYLTAFAARHLFLADIVPISTTREPQPVAALELAFLLRATEHVAGGCALIIVAVLAVGWLRRRSRASTE